MGLDTSHNAWNGSYSAYRRWRSHIAILCGLGDLNEYEGYTGKRPVNEIQDSGIRLIIDHSDCDGSYSPIECNIIASSLERLLDSPFNDVDLGGHIGSFRYKTTKYMEGCRLAYERGEDLVFG